VSGTPLRAEAYLAPETLAQLSPFELRARMVVEGISSGMHSSPKQGMAVEFAEHRPYTPGERVARPINGPNLIALRQSPWR
jgi:uncharacterized protein (DUF58 family)